MDPMNIAGSATVAEIAVQHPTTVKVFERFGIDYCCGGRKPLEQACNELQLSLEQVLEKVTEAKSELVGEEAPDWQLTSLAKLIQHIVRRHHAFVRQELPRLNALSEKVQNRHGQVHDELNRIGDLIGQLAQELLAH